jgi:hypothetical protein
VSDEPLIRRWVLRAYRSAAHALYDANELATIAANLPDDARAETYDPPILHAEWLPDRYVIAWSFAVWDGPAKRTRAGYVRFSQKWMDLGFGRLRRALLNLASPRLLIERAPTMWREDHSHGNLEYEFEGEKAAVLRLRDSPYCELPQSRAAMAECFRYSISLARAKDVSETHALESPGVLRVRLSWT